MYSTRSTMPISEGLCLILFFCSFLLQGLCNPELSKIWLSSFPKQVVGSNLNVTGDFSFSSHFHANLILDGVPLAYISTEAFITTRNRSEYQNFHSSHLLNTSLTVELQNLSIEDVLLEFRDNSGVQLTNISLQTSYCENSSLIGVKQDVPKNKGYLSTHAFSCLSPNIAIHVIASCQADATWNLTSFCEVCGEPPKLKGGLLISSDSSYRVQTTVKYDCKSGFLKRGTDDTNECLAGGIWRHPTVTYVACVSPKMLVIFDGNRNVNDCVRKESDLASTSPFQQNGGFLTRANFPVYFDELDFTSRPCWFSTNHLKRLQTFFGAFPFVYFRIFLFSPTRQELNNMQYRCLGRSIKLLLQCAMDYHYTLGTSSEVNVTLLISDDISTGESFFDVVYRVIDGVRATLPAQLYTVSLVRPQSPSYKLNSEYLSQIACGTGVKTGCKYFLGSIYDPDIMDKIRTVDFTPAGNPLV